MDVASQDWLTALAFAIIGGGLIGWVFGHKMKQGASKVLTTPLALQSGSTSRILVLIGLGLIGVTFTIGVWQGVVAVVLGFIANSIVGSRVMHDINGGLGKAIKTVVLLLAVVCLPFGGYQYYRYNRTPDESDARAFVYDCTNYSLKSVFENSRPSKVAIAAHQEDCTELWRVLVNKYQTMGKINSMTRNNGNFGLYGNEAHEIYSSIKYRHFDSAD